MTEPLGEKTSEKLRRAGDRIGKGSIRGGLFEGEKYLSESSRKNGMRGKRPEGKKKKQVLVVSGYEGTQATEKGNLTKTNEQDRTATHQASLF